eukprot:TRINITY_DN5890_c0_g1_i1.p1 TRINITY_DN5890_c0_g1~~TRINITY_DN5890_c0_g1_i1.p1  ORF type:complete len:240 (+),score=60.23 TRINITY_DN5890_c0_g1_i1:100-819(+)
MMSSSLPEIFHFDPPSERRPSNDEDGPLVIGVCGGSAGGKTTVCKTIIGRLENKRAIILSQDSFYKVLSAEERANVANFDFDHPDAFDWPLICDCFRSLRSGKPFSVPIYDFCTHSRKLEKHDVYGVDVILFEGIHVFHSSELRELLDIKIFVDEDADTRLMRRIIRDVQERGRDLNGILDQYERFVKPAFETWILPSKKHADIIVPRGASNTVAIKLIVEHTKGKLDKKYKSTRNKFT